MIGIMLTLTPRISRYFKDYEYYHQTQGNKVTHYIGITLIVLSLLGLLANWTFGMSSPLFRLDGGVLLLCLGVVFYLWLDWRVALPFSFVLTGMYFLGRAIPTTWNWNLFIVGWVFQAVGHYYFEKKSPAFFKNLTHILIGPLWIFSRVMGFIK